jgi:outer membrane protein OmpA-like peptidoglycan-associated protein
MPNQSSLDRLLLFVNLANATGRPVQSTAVVAPGAAGGDLVRFIGLDQVSFPEGTPVIGPAHGDELNRLAQVIRNDPALRVIVLGRSDQRGDEAQNLAVSQRRAEAVVAYLVGQGVDAARLTAVGIGESQPTSTGENEADFMLNRRAEFVVFGFASAESAAPVPTEPVESAPATSEPVETTEA